MNENNEMNISYKMKEIGFENDFCTPVLCVVRLLCTRMNEIEG